MFGSTSPFGQSSNSPFGSQPAFGQTSNTNNNPFAPKPFGSTTPFGGQTGSSLFGGTSTGVFGQAQSSPFGASSSSTFGNTSAFGATSTPAFGATSTPAFGSSSTPTFGVSGTSAFGQKPSFGPFGSGPAQTSPFGSTAQPSQQTFGSNMFGSSTPFGGSQSAFGSSSTPPFGTPQGNQPFGGTQTFGTTNTSPFGGPTTPTFPSTSAFATTTNTSPFGGSTGSAFAPSSSPLFGTGGFGASNTSTFGSSTSAFGGSTSASGFNFSSSPSYSQSSSTFGVQSSSSPFGVQSSSSPFGVQSSSSPFGVQSASSPFGVQSSSFGAQSTTSALGNNSFGQSAFGGQRGGSRVAPYTSTTESDGSGNAVGKLDSISAMTVYKDKSHEELRWEDYQSGDKGGPNPAGGNTFGVNTFGGNPFGIPSTQTNPLTPAPSLSQTTSSIFNTSTPAQTTNNIFGGQKTPFSSTGFGSSSSPFSSTPATSIFPSTPSSSPFSQSTTAPSPFSTSTPSAFTFPSTPANNFNPTPSVSQTTFGQNTSTFGNPNPFGTQNNLFNTSGTFGTSSSGNTSNQSGFTQSTPLFPSFSQPLQTNTFGFNSTFNQTQPGTSVSGGILGQNNLGQNNLAQMPVQQGSVAVQQPVPATNPYGTLPAMPQISIGRGGTAPSIQYGISSMPVVDKPVPVRITSILTPRHLSQRRVSLSARKYNPQNDSKKVAFFTDDEETPSTPKGDVSFHPRENPRALVIRPKEQWPRRASAEKLSPSKDTTTVNENGINSGEAGSRDRNDREQVQDNGVVKEHLHVKTNQKSNGAQDDQAFQKGDSYTTLNGHRAGEAAIVYEHGADIEAQMPKLRRSDYYTEPRIQELAAKERAEPGFCCRVKDFVVGRRGYGSIKFLGETDVRRLDLDSLVQFNNKEVIVYRDESKKPPVGQGLNKPAEVTLLNIKCIERKTGIQFTEGPNVEKYKEMLEKKAKEQGAKFVSFDAKKEEWTFMVNHFSEYKLEDDCDWDADAAQKDC